MRTVSRTLALLFIVLCTTFLPCTPAEAGRRNRATAPAPAPRPAVSELVTSSNGYHFVYANDGTLPPYSVHDTKRYRLLVPKALLEKHAIDKIAEACDKGFDRIEERLGKFERKMNIFIPQKIVPNEADVAKRLRILGLQFKNGGRECIAVAIDAVSVDIFAHEALHYRMGELGLSPIWWLEEGIAEFVETADGFNDEHLKKLVAEGPIAVETLNKLERSSTEEMRARATAWAIVYHMVNVDKKSLAEIAKASIVPPSEKAFQSARSAERESGAKEKGE